MRKIIAKHIGYPLQDLIKGTNILGIKNFLLDTQSWEKEKIEEYQFNKLKKLMQHAYTNVPYYRSLFNEYGIKPDDIKDIFDFKKIPILTKEIARKENSELISNNISFNRVNIGKTGGTTGPSLILQKDTSTRSFAFGAYYRWYNWMGIDIGDPIIRIWGTSSVLNKSNTEKLKEVIVSYIQNITCINSFNMNERTFPGIVKVIQSKKHKLIRGYLSAVLQLANYINDNNIQFYYPTAVSTTTETLLPHLREYLEKTFHCDIYDQYGCGECESIAFECSKHNGLHITSEHVFLEILDDTNNDLKTGIGRIIVTDLDNYAMPFIRYENGDTAEFQSNNCSCGINLPLLKEIYGRTSDTITLANGSEVHGVFFTDILYELDQEQDKKVRKFQAFQEKSGQIEFRIEASAYLNNNYLNNLEKVLNRFFTKVEIKIVKELTYDKSGKFRYVISNIRKES